MKASQDFIKDKILFWGNIYNFFSARKGYDNLGSVKPLPTKK